MAMQIKIRIASADSVARTPSFRDGVRDFMNGTAPRFDGWPDTNTAWAYERGRLAAAQAVATGAPVPKYWFEARRLTPEAKRFIRTAVNCGAVR